MVSQIINKIYEYSADYNKTRLSTVENKLICFNIRIVIIKATFLDAYIINTYI